MLYFCKEKKGETNMIQKQPNWYENKLTQVVLGVIFIALLLPGSLMAQQRILRDDLSFPPGMDRIERVLNLNQSGILNVIAASVDLQPSLGLQSPDGTMAWSYDQGSSALLQLPIDQPGSYTLVIEALQGRIQDPGKVSVAVTLDRPLSRLSSTTEIRGELTQNSSTYEQQKFINWYQYTVPQTGRVNIELLSTDFDAYLVVMKPDGEVEINDDANGSDSALRVTSVPGSNLFIGATTFGGNTTGRFNLRVSPGAAPTTLQLNRTREGQFSAGQGLGTEFRFTAPTDGRYLVELFDSDQEGTLQIIDSKGEEVFEYFEVSEFRRVAVRLARGEYIDILPQSYGSEGRFSVQITEMPGAQDISNLTSPISDFLASGDILEYTYRVGDFEGVLVFDLLSDDFDTYLELETSRGDFLFDDDSFGGGFDYRSLIRYQVQPGDEITIFVRAYFSSQSGEFYLDIYPDQPPADLNDYVPGLSLSRNSQTTFLMSGEPHLFSLDLQQGQTITIAMDSDDFDSYIELAGPSGQYWDDDDGGGNLNSLLTITAPETGTYELTARAFGFSAVGYYTLSID